MWLTAFVLFAVSLLSWLKQVDYWWVIGFCAVLISQYLILVYWKDAKFGTIINVVILALIATSYGAFYFHKKVENEVAHMLNSADSSEQSRISQDLLQDLPPVIQKWLTGSGIIGTEAQSSIYLEQDAQMLMTPDQKNWSHASAVQYFTTEPPAFNWSVNTKMQGGIPVVGRDKFENGKGEMIIKMCSLIPVVNVKNNKKVDQASLQRYLAETVWFPSAALNKYIKWEAIDDFTARATMTYKGTQGSGVFHFDKNGQFKKFVAMRYKDVEENSGLQRWTVTATKTEVKNGIMIPVELNAAWNLDEGDWTWLKLKIKDIQYNPPINPQVIE